MVKRVFDILLSLFGLIVLFPFLIVVGLLIRFMMGSPILFNQERGGRHGNTFIIHKFRTMTVGHSGNSISVKGENRITALGAILRKYKIDELPELWNVLKGDMSFVGPRPDVPEYYDRLIGEEKEILKLRPGITGPASLKYYNEEELLAAVENPKKYNDEIIWPDKVKINLEYYYNQSLLKDIQLIIKTVLG